MAIMKVRVVKCSNNNWWYRDEIGNEYEVEDSEYPDDYRIIDKDCAYLLSKTDCEIIKEDSYTTDKWNGDTVRVSVKQLDSFSYLNLPKDPISPEYYKGKIECIDAIAEATKDLQGIEAVDTAQIIKYIWRWKKKNGIEDLNKALFYLNHLIKLCETHKSQS